MSDTIVVRLTVAVDGAAPVTRAVVMDINRDIPSDVVDRVMDTARECLSDAMGVFMLSEIGKMSVEGGSK